MSKWDDAMTEIGKLNDDADLQAKVTSGLTTEVTAHRGRLTAVEGRVNEHDALFAGIDSRLAQQNDRLVMTAQLADQTAAQVDTHTQQIATHDSWFVGIWDRLGAAVDWTTVWTISIITGLLTIPMFYFWVFEQYGFTKVYTNGNLSVEAPGDPARMWLISAAIGVFVAFVVAFILSFVMRRADETNQSAPASPAVAEPEPEPATPATPAPAVPVADLPAPPPAAPVSA